MLKIGTIINSTGVYGVIVGQEEDFYLVRWLNYYEHEAYKYTCDWVEKASVPIRPTTILLTKLVIRELWCDE